MLIWVITNTIACDYIIDFQYTQKFLTKIRALEKKQKTRTIIKIRYLPLFPTEGAPMTATFTSLSEDFLRRMPLLVMVVDMHFSSLSGTVTAETDAAATAKQARAVRRGRRGTGGGATAGGPRLKIRSATAPTTASVNGSRAGQDQLVFISFLTTWPSRQANASTLVCKTFTDVAQVLSPVYTILVFNRYRSLNILIQPYSDQTMCTYHI